MTDPVMNNPFFYAIVAVILSFFFDWREKRKKANGRIHKNRTPKKTCDRA